MTGMSARRGAAGRRVAVLALLTTVAERCGGLSGGRRVPGLRPGERAGRPMPAPVATTTQQIISEGDPIVGLTVHKIGRTTGHTVGVVQQTCVGLPQGNPDGSDTGRTLLCQSTASYGSLGGDSGGPVFSVGGGELDLRGIHWGGGGAFSNQNQVERELREAAGTPFGATVAAAH